MNYKKLKYEELKDYCKKNGLSIEGKRDDLIQRLTKLELNKTSQLTLAESDVQYRKKEIASSFFIQLKISNISYYFNAGIIYPLSLEESEIYKNENRKKDIFNIYPEHIILTKQPLNQFDEDDALIEIITDELVLDSLTGYQVFYFSEPIPISRVKKIIFKSNQAKNTFIASVKSFPDFFIPEQLCSSLESFEPVSINLKDISLPSNTLINNWRERLGYFDKIMGMFAFMKNAGIFYAEKDNVYEEYTTNYFNVLKLVNSKIDVPTIKDVTIYKYILFPDEIESSTVQRFLFKKIIDEILNNSVFDLQKAHDIISEVRNSNLCTENESYELDVILEQLKKLDQHQISYKELLLHEVIKKNYPAMALVFLSRFSNKSRQHTDKQAVRNIFISQEAQFSKNLSEYLLAVLGLYYGYKSMINKDTNLRVLDTTFSFLLEHQQNIKFKLSSTLDRVTIESIFNFCKEKKTVSNDFSFLNINSRAMPVISNSQKMGMYEYIERPYFILNTKITIIERKNILDKFISLLDKNYSNKISNQSFLLHYLLSNFDIDKRIIVDILRSNINKITKDDIEKIILLDSQMRNKKNGFS